MKKEDIRVGDTITIKAVVTKFPGNGADINTRVGDYSHGFTLADVVSVERPPLKAGDKVTWADGTWPALAGELVGFARGKAWVDWGERHPSMIDRMDPSELKRA